MVSTALHLITREASSLDITVEEIRQLAGWTYQKILEIITFFKNNAVLFLLNSSDERC